MSEEEGIKTAEYAPVGPVNIRTSLPSPVLEAIEEALICVPMTADMSKAQARAMAMRWVRKELRRK